MVVIEGLALCFWMLIICVVGIANGCEKFVVFYEQDVKDRVVELGLTTAEQIKKSSAVTVTVLFVPMLLGIPAMVYGINGAEGFWDGFRQMTFIYIFSGLFDRLFIDWYWVGHTKAWQIPGTEDLMPYIPKKTLITKWFGTLVGMPLIAAVTAAVMSAVMK